MVSSKLDCVGFCLSCARKHRLPAEPALNAARKLVGKLQKYESIGLGLCDDPRLNLNYLFGPARGQMFGVLVARDQAGSKCVLRAFSGQYNSMWTVPGWVPPLLDPEAFARTIATDEPRIKDLSRCLDRLNHSEPTRLDLIRQRRKLSQGLMARIFDLYHLANFRGQTQPLTAIFRGQGMPTGTGECCAPKLLHHAALHGLTPVGLAEIYVGRENRSGTRHHGEFYAPCAEKCQPILGFLLCGLDG